MLSVLDLYGVAAVIAACTGLVTAVFGGLNHRTVSNIDRKTDTNGDPRELGQIMSDVGQEVAPATKPPAPTP